MTRFERSRELLRRAWETHAVLAAATLLFAGLLIGSGLMLVGDSRVAAGQFVWVKPMKFAASSGIYCVTLLALVGSVRRPAWGLRRAATVSALVLVVDVVIVGFQAARGTTSHFNVSTPLNAVLWAALGVSILVLLVASTVFAVGLFRSPVADRAWGWALRLGMAASVVGAGMGGLMVDATDAQRAAITARVRPTAIGAHTVGGADGGAGLPGIGWSRDHGDLRIPHFFGLHALQAIPLLSWLALGLLRPVRESTRLALVLVVAASYSGLVGLLVMQALTGRSLLQIDGPTLAALGAWAALTALGALIILVPGRSRADASTRLAVGA